MASSRRRLLLVLLMAAGLPAACAAPGSSSRQSDAAAQILADTAASHQANLAGLGAPSPALLTSPASPMGHAVSHPQVTTQRREATAAAGEARPSSSTPTAAATASAPTLAGELVGLDPEGVMRWLGQPRLRRTEGSAEVWHYQGPTCHLDLVLYGSDGPAGPALAAGLTRVATAPAARSLYVAFASARAAGGTLRQSEAACLNDIAGQATRGATSGGDSAAPGGAASAQGIGAAAGLGI